jgi:5-methylcytosine-specific restriction endonuclease McrBC regulatory subunit McrC
MKRPLRSDVFIGGIQAMEWTIDERGLAGLSDREGVPWKLPMNEFFEAWVETVFHTVARRTGAQIKVGRKQETRHPIHWEPGYLGSQKSLIPDVWLEWDSTTLIVDAKYKRHWEELQNPWSTVADELRQQHRGDLLQVLAYANLARTPNVLACLAYPCSPDRWKSLRERRRLIHRAELTIGNRSLQLWLTALPMAIAVDRIADALSEQVRAVLRVGTT